MESERERALDRRREEPELLAPAGNWDCVRAAVAGGADAVYFGLPAFNARMRADNFREDELPALMEFLHGHGLRGLAAFNTLVFTGELEEAARLLRVLEEAGVDAVIVQDLGLARLARRVAPGLALHASTQMTLTSPEGLRLVDGWFGLDRAVLARELSLRDLARFSPGGGAPEVPLEVFVHGALCVAYSGQCLTSESLGQRSANRGECAQACRLPYELVVDGRTRDLGDQRYLLSPQDLAAVDLLPDLLRAGVRSFKIEGRLKSPEYVAAVTRVYRRALDAAWGGGDGGAPAPATADERYALEMVFSRGLSTGWLEGANHPGLTHGRFGKKRGVLLGKVRRAGPDWVELEPSGAAPVSAGDGVVFATGGDPDREPGGRLVAVRGDRLVLRRGKPDLRDVRPGMEVWKTDDPRLNAGLRALWESRRVEAVARPVRWRVSGAAGQALVLRDLESGAEARSDEPLQAARNRPLDTALLEEQLGRLGGTPYRLATLENRLEGEVMLPVSALNRLRRALVEARQRAEAASGPVCREEPGPGLAVRDLLPRREAAAVPEEPELAVLCRSLPQVEAALASGARRLYVDFEDPRRYREAVDAVRRHGGEAARIFLATPRIQKAGESGYFRLLQGMEPDGILVRNLGALAWFRRFPALSLAGDFSLNVANPLSAGLLMGEGLEGVAISCDLNAEQVVDLLRAAPPRWFEVILHQHMALFHMEHCVFCAFLSSGTDHTNCGRPCEHHHVQLRDRVGQLHELQADVGCRNTLFHGRAQTGARCYPALRAAGASRFRLELLRESAEETGRVVRAYQELLAGTLRGEDLWRRLGVLERLGVTEGTLAVR